MSEIKEHGELLVWDNSGQVDNKKKNIIHWQSFEVSQDKSIYSIPRLVEENSKKFRLKYLELIYLLGNSNVGNENVVDMLEIRPGFSFWWMTLITEQCNYAKSPQIDNIVKLMTFEEWIGNKKFNLITLVTSNIQLAEAVKNLADKLSIEFHLEFRKNANIQKSPIHKLYDYIPSAIKTILWVPRKLISRWGLKGVGVDEWSKTNAKTTVVSYLFNLEPDLLHKGQFGSRYWSSLPQFLSDNHMTTNWLHIFVEDELIPNSKSASKTINSFNASGIFGQTHVTLYSFLSVRLVLSVLKDWFKLFRLTGLIKESLIKSSGIYWPLLRKDYLDSMVGPVSMNNLLDFHLFERAMSILPPQKKGCYLQENQGWEFGFIYSWQASHHGKALLGVPHTPAKFWDLRTYFDKRCFQKRYKCNLPMPDYIGVNGDAAKNMYLEGHYPKEKLIGVEALRYLQLNAINSHSIQKEKIHIKNKTLLVLGDYLKENTQKQMRLLCEANRYVNTKIQYVVKSHPACLVNATNYPELDLIITNEPIHTLINSCSFVYTSSTTSSAVDAYCAGKKVITILDPQGLNQSPLKNNTGVYFVATPKELAVLLNDSKEMQDVEGQGENYFYFDSSLPKWRKFLVDKTNNENFSGSDDERI